MQGLFSESAPRYDFLTRMLSFGIDRRWRKQTVKRMALPEGARHLDLCCGTGGLALGFVGAGAAVTGADFALPMLPLARAKANGQSPPLEWLQADAQSLPFDTDAFDGVSIAFGIRNVENPQRGIAECHRVLRPGGKLAVLEFFPIPNRIWGALFRFYFHRVLPLLARVVRAGRTGAYEYLPASVEDFPRVEEFMGWMESAGFEAVEQRSFSGGVARLVIGTKSGGDA